MDPDNPQTDHSRRHFGSTDSDMADPIGQCRHLYEPKVHRAVSGPFASGLTSNTMGVFMHLMI